jgi:ATP-dependent Clp protease ATP-binding subunit ClpC
VGLFGVPSSRATGGFFLVLFLFLVFFALDAFYYSFYFKNVSGEELYFELADIVFNTPENDVTKGFVNSAVGRAILSRCGFSDQALKDFLKGRKLFVPTSHLQVQNAGSLFEGYMEAVFSADQEFKNFILAHGLTPQIVTKASAWVFGMLERKKSFEHWWSAQSLSRIAPIGREWAYGVAYGLMRWSRPIRFSTEQVQELHAEEISTLETFLSRAEDANVLVVGEEGSGKMEILEGLARKIFHETVSRSLVDKKILVIDAPALISEATEKSAFEKLLIGILNSAVEAGNIILVFPDFSGFIRSAEALQSDIEGLLTPYLTSQSLHIVGVSDLPQYHEILESNQTLKTRFETLFVKEGDEKQVLRILEEEILSLEYREGVFFTYPAILEAIHSARQYFAEESLFGASVDLLIDATAFVKEQGRSVLFAEDILSVVKTKTGIPTGSIDEMEKDKLQNLEKHLHERIVGQNEAIDSMSDALRRARSGITNPNRPIGSFLFLGPTGVGKTETTKALAEIFFGEKAKIHRLDMSEYNTPDSLNRLIGAFDGDTPGVLSSMIRESPYGVLLLDEFEKTNEKVLDLFLQILDEGFFSDVLGRKVNARNLIIVATSNAGSEEIFELVERKENLNEQKDTIIDHIISQGIFKPELLNRFDGVILFHPLSDTDLREVAKIMLARLSWRLKEKGMELVVNNALLDFLVEKGSDPKFGARPLNRAIQDTIEKIIADKIIAGELRPGSKIEFSEMDLR